jgi:hypothetical protein
MTGGCRVKPGMTGRGKTGLTEGESLAGGNRRSIGLGAEQQSGGAQLVETSNNLACKYIHGCFYAYQRSNANSQHGHRQQEATAVGRKSIQGGTENISHHKSSK